LKGISAGQRHTDRQTNAGKNKGPSGLQSGQYFGDMLGNNNYVIPFND